MAESSCPALRGTGSLGVVGGLRFVIRAVVSLVHVSVLLVIHSPDRTSYSIIPSWDSAT